MLVFTCSPTARGPFFTMELLDGETLAARVHRLGQAAGRGCARDRAPARRSARRSARRRSRPPRLQESERHPRRRSAAVDHRLRARARNHLGGEARATVEFIGTPAYMAPEQVSRGHKIGPAADIYALGVVLFELVTGDWPFRRDSALATAAARLTDDPPSPRVLVPDLPVAWEAAILRCLARDPAKRFARASDVIAALVGRRPIRWRRLALIAGGFAVLGGGYATLRMTSTPSCGAPPLPDLYVDQAARPGGNGSRGCPVKTISDALAIGAERKVIHVGAGIFDRAHGERFPLEIRGEVALLGAGSRSHDDLRCRPLGWQGARRHARRHVASVDRHRRHNEADRDREPVDHLLASRAPNTTSPASRAHEVARPPRTRACTTSRSVRITAPRSSPEPKSGLPTPDATSMSIARAFTILRPASGRSAAATAPAKSRSGSRFITRRSPRFTIRRIRATGINVWDCPRSLLVEESSFATPTPASA